MSVIIDNERGNGLAKLLYDCFSANGILGVTYMPEDIAPKNVEKGSLDHLLFITFTVSIDYQRDATSLWESSRRSFDDPETRYLFAPKSLHETPFEKIVKDMRKYRLSQKPLRDADIWRTIGITFFKKWGGDPRNFLEHCNWDSRIILKRLRTETHLQNGKLVPDYPNLRGAKIGPLWLRMLRDNVGINLLKNLEQVPIPVDIHVARATLTTGVVRGQFSGRLEELFEDIREAWSESVKGLSVKDRPMIALDVDEPLWHLSRYGCSKYRDKMTGDCTVSDRCEAREFCIKGKVKIENSLVELAT